MYRGPLVLKNILLYVPDPTMFLNIYWYFLLCRIIRKSMYSSFKKSDPNLQKTGSGSTALSHCRKICVRCNIQQKDNAALQNDGVVQIPELRIRVQIELDPDSD